MTCPICGEKSTVVCSRREPDLIVRKRECIDCGHVFYSTELELPDSRIDFSRIDGEYQKQRKWRRYKERNDK